MLKKIVQKLSVGDSLAEFIESSKFLHIFAARVSDAVGSFPAY